MSDSPPPRQRKVLHLDMDAFFASVEQRDHPELRGRPVAVGGPAHGRGVVAAASYEARRFGVRSALPMAQALRLCPNLVVVPPRFSQYRAVSEVIHAIFHLVTDLVEPLSLDEAYLDVSENKLGEPSATRLARWLKERVRAETGLTVSAGVAPNKFLAKVASDLEKPDGLTVIRPEQVADFLETLPVRKLWGVGPRTAERLEERGWLRVGELRQVARADLCAALGDKLGAWLHELSQGRDERPVQPTREPVSRGAEHTLAQDLTDPAALDGLLVSLAERVQRSLEGDDLRGRTVTVKVRYSDFHTITRSRTLPGGVLDLPHLIDAARELLAASEAGRRPVRLIGVSVGGLAPRAELAALALRQPQQLWLPLPGFGPRVAPR